MVSMDVDSLWSTLQPFIFGGLAGMAATTVIQPVDMVKVRLQLAGEGMHAASRPSPFSIAKTMIKSNGIASLYTGLSAGLLRQATYTTARMGIFNSIMSALQGNDKTKKVTMSQRAAAGLAAGALGAIVGNPCDLALIRMQADGMLPAAQRSNYKSVIDAMTRISKDEGVLALWKGSGPTVARAMALNLGMLSTYSEAKSRIEPHLGKNSAATQFGASAIAGFFASFFSLPFDFVKTRLQRQKADPVTGKLPYAGSLDCALKVARSEGPLAFYKGFATYYVRIAPHAMITLLVADALNNLVKKH
ncbi:putative mitochondrial 2-oxoglutarate/malate carrier protein [Blyttiomyces sp. JEL0837]|nr:putative mitochondrial 2-oxoglutarate/malate carrier protein [Blyttiomyces sp. JEL0837]